MDEVKMLAAETSGNLIGNVHLADCLDLCERVYRAGVRVDMILADLPYQVTQNHWDVLIPLTPMWRAFNRVIKPCGVIVLTAVQPFTSLLVSSNLEMFRYEWIWHKSQATGHLNALNQPMREHENILIFSRDKHMYNPQIEKKLPQNIRPITPRGVKTDSYGEYAAVSERTIPIDMSYPRSVIRFENPNHGEKGLHPTQKPVSLFQYLIRTYTQAGEIVLDPTCGSGTTARGALKEGRRFIVGDNALEYVQAARDSLRLPFEPLQVQREATIDDLPLFAARPA